MSYTQLRKDILQNLNLLQNKGFSYQAICDYINNQKVDFVLYKDFFSRFQSKPTYFNSSAKHEKLFLIHQSLNQLCEENINEEDIESNFFKTLISNVAAVKFETFLNINRSVDLPHTQLSEFYLENSPAFQLIEDSVNHKKQYNWELDIFDYKSTFKILAIQSYSIFTHNAIVTSKESWKLFWIDKDSKQLQFKLESSGQNNYLLAKDEEDNWKVVENRMETATQKKEPKYIDYTKLEELLSKSMEENKRTIANFLSNEDLLSTIEFIKIIFLKNLPPYHLSILARIKKSYLDSHRLLNTDVIDFSLFQAEIGQLKKQLTLISDGIFIITK
jgi:hypothetical protein